MHPKDTKPRRLCGPAHPAWKGGRHVTPGGYVWINVPGRGNVLEHRYVMEQHLGRALLTEEHVHHLNGNPSDNRLENLQVLSRAEHGRITAASAPRRAQKRQPQRTRAQWAEQVRGPAHPAWKGGRCVTKTGHVLITVPGRGSIFEHRYVVELQLGRPLAPDEQVHHINGDPSDNRIENLQIVTQAEHNRIHGLNGRWSKTHERCAACSETSRPHFGGGLCQRCYQRTLRPDHPRLDGQWAYDHPCCAVCGCTDRPHRGKGLCSLCYKRQRRAANPGPGLPRGAQHPMARLGNDDVRAISRLLSQGVTQRVIAQQFGVSQATVARIAGRRSWRHLFEEDSA